MLLQRINRFRYVYNLLYHQTGLGFPPGHYYSPIVNKSELLNRDELFENFPRQIPNIDLREAQQMKLLEQFSKLYPTIPFSKAYNPDHRYHYDALGNQYCYSDAIMLHCIMRTFNPQQIIEVGSGFSSAVMLDTNQLFFNNTIQFTFIEPYPERLYGLLRDEDHKRTVTYEKGLQEIDLKEFDKLAENDILFIDSTHVSKTGSDVNQVIFNILPRLQKGVLIHFHDIFYPFEYPKDWVINSTGFGWNEAYILRAFLMNNSDYEIVLFNTFMENFHLRWFEEYMPLCLENKGGSIWLRKK
ncbi:class I SAM-dependent methyltransferase [Spirosoma sp. BT702]|uniref:Class I SAM-dependent methyltransferase n=1 Tax=Spirosoma profusum TaxID=2771354 RepID=A0A927AQK4_9BACT|nr:class I SAM-dependent methyltransferase [Spirosoma profusum]MBD2700708.1 class I SAM-dependent methyltransferase [Spirosoma profusum]